MPLTAVVGCKAGDFMVKVLMPGLPVVYVFEVLVPPEKVRRHILRHREQGAQRGV